MTEHEVERKIAERLAEVATTDTAALFVMVFAPEVRRLIEKANPNVNWAVLFDTGENPK